MKASVIDKEEMFFLGMEETFASAADHDADLVMFTRFMPQASAFEKYAVDDALYALGRTSVDGSCTYMVAKRVERLDTLPGDVPADSVYKSVPAATYAAIEVTPRQLGREEESKVEQWLKENPEYRRNAQAFGIEFYPPECRSADDGMWVWVPLSQRCG